MKISLLFFINLILFSCSFSKQEQTLGLGFSVDVNDLRTIAASSSGSIDGLSTKVSTSPTPSDDQDIYFFGVVIRDVEGVSELKSQTGFPQGKVIPGASKILSAWTNPFEINELNRNGRVKIMVDVPSPSKISITVFAVFIRDDDMNYGPGSWTSIFHVAGPFDIEGATRDVHVNVGISHLEDDNKEFFEWVSFFADLNGNPLANKNVSVRHCKIGFVFEQSMFMHSLEDRFLFRTNNHGMINSVVPSGIDWEIIVDKNVVKPCGVFPDLFNVKNYTHSFEGAQHGIHFTAFIGKEIFINPMLFTSDHRITHSQFGFVYTGDQSVDHDGDGLPTAIELTETKSNPFVKNELIEGKLRGDWIDIMNISVESSYINIDYRVKNTDTSGSGSCTDGQLMYFNSTNWPSGTYWQNFSGGTPTEITSDSYYFYCRVYVSDTYISSLIPPGSVGKVYIKLNSGFEADLDGVAKPLVTYSSLNWCKGVGCNQKPIINSFKVFKEYKSSGPSGILELVTDYQKLLPSGCGNNFRYKMILDGIGFDSGGEVYFATSSDCNEANKYEQIYAWTRSVYTDKYEFGFGRSDNTPSSNVYFCYKKALNSIERVGLPPLAPAFKFIDNPNYSNDGCEYYSGENYFTDFNIDTSILYGDLNSGSGPNVNFSLSQPLSSNVSSIKLHFDLGGHICIQANFPEGTQFFSSNTNYYHNLNEFQTYSLQSVVFFTDPSCITFFDSIVVPGPPYYSIYVEGI